MGHITDFSIRITSKNKYKTETKQNTTSTVNGSNKASTLNKEKILLNDIKNEINIKLRLNSFDHVIFFRNAHGYKLLISICLGHCSASTHSQ